MLGDNGMDNNRCRVTDDIRFRAINHFFSVSESYCASMALSMLLITKVLLLYTLVWVGLLLKPLICNYRKEIFS